MNINRQIFSTSGKTVSKTFIDASNQIIQLVWGRPFYFLASMYQYYLDIRNGPNRVNNLLQTVDRACSMPIQTWRVSRLF